MKIRLTHEQKFGFFIFLITTIVTTIITMELLRFSGSNQVDSAMLKKIENLVSLLKESNEHNEQLSKEVIKLEKEIFELKHGISPNGTSFQVKELYKFAGLADVTGSGLTIRIIEQMPKNNLNKDYTNVLQSDDLLRLVNILKASGATAISVNEQRLVVNSEITHADNCIVINKKKISPPYIINVLGDFETINSALTIRGGIIEYLKYFNIDTYIDKQENVTIKAFNM